MIDAASCIGRVSVQGLKDICTWALSDEKDKGEAES